mmetsp:Transcript_27439/g.50594  ORF Transcript_27439/g.50594 Transcript_27439/m.50594 type:complete len:188 (+) Transcript_27439:1968-2531(+)
MRPNLSAFISQIADHLNCKRHKSTPLNGNIWRVGAIDTPAGDVALYLAPNMQNTDDVRDVLSALAGEVKFAFGLIYRATGVLSVPPYVTVQLLDILNVDPRIGKLTVIANLESIAGVPEKRAGGRPSPYAKPHQHLYDLRLQEGRALQGRNEEAQALRNEFQSKFPSEGCPSLVTVRNFVSARRGGS